MKKNNWGVFVCVILMNFLALHARNTDKFYQPSNCNKDETSEETKNILIKAINKLFGEDQQKNSGDTKYYRLNSITSQNFRKPNYKNEYPRLIVLEIEPSELEAIKKVVSNNLIKNQVSDEENTANEIIDQLAVDSEEDSNESYGFRRKTHREKYRDRKRNYDRNKDHSSSTETSDSSTDLEKNEGNPYTIHKNAYKQNWMWNYQMDGNHMNINPYAPQLNEAGPSGADLFFMRKWWYFNQDDYKPMGRRK